MIKVCSLSSGSNGNAFFLQTGSDSFLVDAGISCKQICLRLEEIGSNIKNIKAIFITHEHSDHIKGLRVLLKKNPIPVYMTEKTYYRSSLEIDSKLVEFIQARDYLKVNDTVIQSLPKSHDAVEPTLFSFFYKGKKVSIITDAGYGCDNVIESIKDANILSLESNYDDDMLKNGMYPYYLKQRVAGRHGHLSNVLAASLVCNYATPKLEYVFLSHLSENNNTPRIAMKTFQDYTSRRSDLQKVNTLLTSRHNVSEIVELKIT
ncbi:MAG: MBL fold metallo-hydrolase [bacterium]|nr:MBL fold metallo-hydrolase [bacterium]